MAKIIPGRMFAHIEGDFVVFMIGMRVNKLWKIHKWLPIIFQMTRMIKELYANSDSGFLGMQNWTARTTIMVQYWKSFEHLESYAKNKTANHFPAWRDFNLRVRKSGAVGIWHETYKITDASFENVYVNMPPFGLGKASKIIPITEKFDNAKERMESKKFS